MGTGAITPRVTPASPDTPSTEVSPRNPITQTHVYYPHPLYSSHPSLVNFGSERFQALNRASLTHLYSLGLPVEDRTVLELGSGPGDHTGFYLDHGSKMTAVDAREPQLRELKRRYPQVETYCINLDTPMSVYSLAEMGMFDVVHCYGLLYHLEHPWLLIEAASRACRETLILCTCVSAAVELEIVYTREDAGDSGQSVSGIGCRPSRAWVVKELRKYFPHVYVTKTQPDHAEFPVDWDALKGLPVWDGISNHGPSWRAVFVASRFGLETNRLLQEIHPLQGICNETNSVQRDRKR